MLCRQQHSPQNQQHCGTDETGSIGGGFSPGAGSDSSVQRYTFSGRHLCRGKTRNRAQPFPRGLQPRRSDTRSLAEISGWPALSGGHSTLQEYIGYCLIPSNKGQRMMVIKGNGGEGKSQIGAVLGTCSAQHEGWQHRQNF